MYTYEYFGKFQADWGNGLAVFSVQRGRIFEDNNMTALEECFLTLAIDWHLLFGSLSDSWEVSLENIPAALEYPGKPTKKFKISSSFTCDIRFVHKNAVFELDTTTDNVREAIVMTMEQLLLLSSLVDDISFVCNHGEAVGFLDKISASIKEFESKNMFGEIKFDQEAETIEFHVLAKLNDMPFHISAVLQLSLNPKIILANASKNKMIIVDVLDSSRKELGRFFSVAPVFQKLRTVKSEEPPFDGLVYLCLMHELHDMDASSIIMRDLQHGHFMLLAYHVEDLIKNGDVQEYAQSITELFDDCVFFKDRANSSQSNDIESQSWHSFEDRMCALVQSMGFSAETTKITGDGGIDIIAYNHEPLTKGKYVIQCKMQSASVGAPIVRELYGAMMSEHANKGILMTTSKFTLPAINFARDKPLELIDGEQLVELIYRFENNL